MVVSEEESMDTRVLHEVAAGAKRAEAGEGRDISELFGDSEAEGETEVHTKALKRKNTVVIETSDSDYERSEQKQQKRASPIRRSKRARAAKAPKSSASSVPAPEEGRKKQKASSKVHASLELTIVVPLELIIPPFFFF